MFTIPKLKGSTVKLIFNIIQSIFGIFQYFITLLLCLQLRSKAPSMVNARHRYSGLMAAEVE